MKKIDLKILLIIIFAKILISCNQREELIQNSITVLEANRRISTSENIVVYENYNLTKDNELDTFKINLTHNDWSIIKKSFNLNKIYTFNKDTKIGEKVNSIELPKTIKLNTNKRTISIKYNYFLGDDETIDKDKTVKFKNFMRTIDSLIYLRHKK